MKYLSVVALFAFVYVISQLLPQSDNVSFFLIQGSWSILMFTVTISLLTTWIGYSICSLELLHILFNIIMCVDYLTTQTLLYKYYGIVNNSINVIEAAILIIGVPWIGARNRFASFIGGLSFGYIFGTWNSRVTYRNRKKAKELKRIKKQK